MREIGIPCIYGLDQNHGTTYTMGGTLFPLKHYMGYSVPFTGKDRTPVYISAQDLREKHFAPFLACVKQEHYPSWQIRVLSTDCPYTPITKS